MSDQLRDGRDVTLEGEEDPECEIILAFGGRVDMAKQAEVVVVFCTRVNSRHRRFVGVTKRESRERERESRTERVVVVGDKVGKGVRDIAGFDHILGFPRFVSELRWCGVSSVSAVSVCLVPKLAHEQEGEYDAAHKDPLGNVESDRYGTVVAAVPSNGVCPLRPSSVSCPCLDASLHSDT